MMISLLLKNILRMICVNQGIVLFCHTITLIIISILIACVLITTVSEGSVLAIVTQAYGSCASQFKIV